jgi:FkbM family methyltransferase
MALLNVKREIGRKIRNARRSPQQTRGLDFISDIGTHLPGISITTIFDVGAHIGMTALEFSDRFPDATVYAFEPSPTNFARMARNLIGKPIIRRHNIGLGAEASRRRLYMDPAHPSMARLKPEDLPFEEVEITTVDQFCLQEGVSKIDILKIDTEGHELAVLEGASAFLKWASIRLIKLECTPDPDNHYHTQFGDVCAVLNSTGFRLFGIYEQMDNTLQPGFALNRFDAAFLRIT